jgi:cell division protein FtsL
MAESKVKSHSRRTKSGQVRVKEGRRKSIGRKVLETSAAITGGSLAAYTIYKGGKKLQGEIDKQKSLRDFKPKAEGFAIRDYESGVLENSRQARVDSVRKSVANARFELLKVREKQAKSIKPDVLKKPFKGSSK